MVEMRNSDNNKKLAAALDESLRMIEAGATIEDCLKLYSKHGSELRDLLISAVGVKKAYLEDPAQPSKQYAKAGREQFLAAIDELDIASNCEPTAQRVEIAGIRSIGMASLFRHVYVASAAAAAAIALLAGSMVYSSAGSAPGGTLYGVKRAAEQVQLALTFDESNKARLHYELAQKRLAEAKQMVKEGEKGEAANAYEEAKESLSEATKIAKATPNNTSKDKLETSINNFSKTMDEQSAKLAFAPKDKKGAGGIHNNGDEKPAGDGDTKTDTNGNQQVASAANAGGKQDNAEGLQGQPAELLNNKPVNDPSNVNETADDKAKKNRHERDLNARQERDIPSTVEKESKSTASIEPFEVDGIEVSDHSFSPDRDGVQDSVSISVFGATSEGLSVGLCKDGVKVASLAEKKSGNSIELRWNGLDARGEKVADGEYTIEVLNTIGQVAHKKAKVVVDTTAPRVELVGPPSGITTDNQAPQFVWNASTDAVRYTLYLNPAGDTKARTMCITGITDSFCELTSKLEPGVWKWRVVAIDGSGNIGSSRVGTFSVEDPIEAQKRLEKLKEEIKSINNGV